MDLHVPVIVKECFPLGIPIERILNLDSINSNDYSLVFKDEEQERILYEKKDFLKRHSAAERNYIIVSLTNGLD